MRLLLTTILAVWIGLGGVQAQDGPQEVTPDQALRMAIGLVQDGQNRAAIEILNALLVRDPDDVQALVVKSRAARNMGQYDTAIQAGRRAWQLSDTDTESYSAAMVTAQALSSDGKRTQAQMWLRRAVDHAPNAVTRTQAVRDFRYVQQRNPWATELSFNISPSDNINNGSRRETTTLFGLPFEFQLTGAAKALTGTEYSAGIATRYRFDQGARHAHDLILQFDHRGYVMSSDAKAKAPGVSGSDFAFTQASVGYVFRAIPENGLGPYTLGVTAGQSWYGGDAYLGYLRLGGTQAVKLDDRTQLVFSGSAERQFGGRAADADVLRGDVILARQVGTAGTLKLSLGASDSMSDNPVADFGEVRGGVEFDLARPFMGAQIGFGLNWRQRDYPVSPLSPGTGRGDTTVSASINVVLTGIERYGFNPTFSVNASRTDSNIGLYDSDTLGIRFGVRSAF